MPYYRSVAYKFSFLSKECFVSYENSYKMQGKKLQWKHSRNDRKKQKLETKENLDDVVAREVNNFAIHQKFGPLGI